jgi:coenzyme F420-reducing hydrogenase delta subunit
MSDQQEQVAVKEAPKTGFTPRIVAFTCNFCAYAAADLAGSTRTEYPVNIKLIRVPCTGRVDVVHILKAFENGADGVYVAGCLEGNCHFAEGNYWAKRRVRYAKKILDEIGIGARRLEMFNLSAAMFGRFVEVANIMNDRITEMGPSPLNK